MSAELQIYRGLCHNLVRRFLRAGLEREDLEQVAALGFVKACRRFDAGRGVPFANYAWRLMCAELLHYVRDHERIVRVPRSLWDLERRERAAAERLTHELGREPAIPEIAAALQAPILSVALVRSGAFGRTSLLEPAARRLPAIEDSLILRDALAALARDERCMLVGVYVLGYSQREIGSRLGYPQRRASRLHARAIAKLAHAVGDVFA